MVAVTTVANLSGTTRYMVYEMFALEEGVVEQGEPLETKTSDMWAFGMTICVSYSNLISLFSPNAPP